MISPDILRFISLRQREGMSRENVRSLLINQGGWSRSDVEEAFGIIDHEAHRPPTSPPVKPGSSEAPIAPVKPAPAKAPVKTQTIPAKPTQSLQANELGQHNEALQSSENSYAAIIAGVVLLALTAAGFILVLFTDVLNL